MPVLEALRTQPVAYTIVILGALLVSVAACTVSDVPSESCTDPERLLQVGFYAFFQPVSHSADPDPASEGFNSHLGYEADLLTALEAMEGAGLSFARRGIASWDDIWLESAGPDFDIVGGGITILDSRTRNAAGEEVVSFTSGHVQFRQSLLVRAEDAGRIVSHSDLTSEMRVGALAGTTGERRLLELTGLVDARGALVEGTRIETDAGALTSDGSVEYSIDFATESPGLKDRRHLYPPAGDMPQVVYLSDGAGKYEPHEALRAGHIDALARGEVGNVEASHASDGAFAVTALDDAVELGGFTLAMEDDQLRSCLDGKINFLTDDRRIGFAEWATDPEVFSRRAVEMPVTHRD
ncbi:MAG: transporter substrate-binding domain-containing protein [Chloroflexota bacterium]|nr:transporter substrate-binding domain-containing protein [Chloroflexota bacterium]